MALAPTVRTERSIETNRHCLFKVELSGKTDLTGTCSGWPTVLKRM